MRIVYIMAMAGALSVTSAHAAKPQIQWNPDYDFSSIETFEWSEPDSISLERTNPFLHSHIVNTIQFHLTSRGLTEVDGAADVRVTYYAATETDTRLQSTSVGYSFGNYGMRGWGYYGYGMGGPVYTTTRTVEVERGTLVVDMWDVSSNELIWRGRVDNITVSDNQQKMQRNLEKAISRMAKQAERLMR